MFCDTQFRDTNEKCIFNSTKEFNLHLILTLTDLYYTIQDNNIELAFMADELINRVDFLCGLDMVQCTMLLGWSHYDGNT